MLPEVAAGEHRRLGRMDPRAKTVALVACVAFAFVPAAPGPVALHAAVLAVICVAGLGARELFRPLRALAPIVVLLVVLTPLFRRGGTALVSIGGNTWITDRGLVDTVRYVCRLVAVTLSCWVYFRSTEMDTAVAAARWFGLPYAACLVLGVAYRLIPTTAALYQGIVDAHSLRRPPPGTAGRGILSSIRRAIPVVTAVLVHSVKGIPVLAMALETRGIGRRGPRSSFHTLPPVGVMVRDLAAALVVLAAPQVVVSLL